MKGKLIAIEGTDGSGKETQSVKLVDKLNSLNIPSKRYMFPEYNSPTGKIIGGSLLGKEEIGPSLFEEPSKVDYLVASAYYAADRRYNIDKINNDLENGINVVLDRYIFSNMAHQGGKVLNKIDRLKVYKKLEQLEFKIMELPYPDEVYFLYMPYEQGEELRRKRGHLDKVEIDKEYLINSENAYLELKDLYNFQEIDCVKDNSIRDIDDISKELLNKVLIKTLKRD